MGHALCRVAPLPPPHSETKLEFDPDLATHIHLRHRRAVIRLQPCVSAQFMAFLLRRGDGDDALSALSAGALPKPARERCCKYTFSHGSRGIRPADAVPHTQAFTSPGPAARGPRLPQVPSSFPRAFLALFLLFLSDPLCHRYIFSAEGIVVAHLRACRRWTTPCPRPRAVFPLPTSPHPTLPAFSRDEGGSFPDSCHRDAPRTGRLRMRTG